MALTWNECDTWLSNAFEPGDAVVMHPDLVHASLPATTDRVRVSLAVDFTTAAGGDRSESAWPSDVELDNRPMVEVVP